MQNPQTIPQRLAFPGAGPWAEQWAGRSLEELDRILLENKIRSRNETEGGDDGTGIDCPRCRNKGWVAVEDAGRMVVRPCACSRRRRTARRLKDCGLLELAKRSTLERFEVRTEAQRTMKELVTAFLADETPGRWLALCGQSGAGKTHLCTAAFVQLTAKRDLEGEYMLWGPALRQIKAELYREGTLLERLKQAPLLYVDDLFKAEPEQGLRDQDLRLSFELLDYRYNNKLPTILSTERTAAELLRLDEAIAGRIRERCGPCLLNIAPDREKNYRLRQTGFCP